MKSLTRWLLILAASIYWASGVDRNRGDPPRKVDLVFLSSHLDHLHHRDHQSLHTLV